MGRLEWLLAGWLLVSAANAVRPIWPIEFWLNAKWAPFFSAGAVFYLVRAHGVSRARLALLGASFTLAQLVASGEGTQLALPAAMIAAIVTAIFALFWLIATGRFQMKPSPFVFYAGALTYPVYVVHQNLGFMIYGRLHQATGLVVVSLASMLALLLAISWCIHTWVERPLGQALRRRLAAPPRARLTTAEATAAVAPKASRG
jgi:peptidoglycan/LPS O-acetylase OafA/YrhL